MKKSIVGLAVASLLVLAGCGNSQANLPKNDATTTGGEASKGASTELVVSTFGLSQDIVERDIIKPFEEANGVKVTLEVGNASERLTKVQSGGSNIDVIELSQSGSTKGTTEGLFETVTEKEIPNLALLTDGAKEVFQNGGGIPFSINSIAIVYDKEKLGREIKDWSDLWSEDLKGKIAIPDITTTGGPLFLSIAADKGGKALKDDKGEAAFKALEELKPNIVKTYSKSSDLANMFQAGEVTVAVVVDFAVGDVSTLFSGQVDAELVAVSHGDHIVFPFVEGFLYGGVSASAVEHVMQAPAEVGITRRGKGRDEGDGAGMAVTLRAIP